MTINQHISKLERYKNITEDKDILYAIDRLIALLQAIERRALFVEDKLKTQAVLQELRALYRNEPDPKAFRNIKKKLFSSIKKDFGLIQKGTYLALALSIGTLLGTIIGSAFSLFLDNTDILVYTLPFGLVFGSLAGNFFEQKAYKEGRILKI